MSSLGRDERCTLYEGESRHTLGTTDTHEMYLEPLLQGFSRQPALYKPFDSKRIAPYKI